MKNKPALLPWILLAIVTSAFLYIRLRLINLPLERDEGEYAYGGQLILRGSPPYRDIYNMKFPGVYYFYSLFILLFGNTTVAIHLGGLIINLITAWLFFKTVELFRNKFTAIYSTIGFIALSASPHLLGVTANTEHFVNLFAVLSAYFLIRWLNQPKSYLLILTGIAAGFACLMKQHGAYFVLVALFAVVTEVNWKREGMLRSITNATILLSGFGIVLLALLTSVLLTGTFHEFFFLTIQYGRSYISYKSFTSEFPNFFVSLANNTANNHIIWLVVLAGMIMSYFLLPRKKFWLLLIWFILSSVAVFPGYYYRDHYYLYIVPVCSIYFGLLFEWLFEWGSVQQRVKKCIPLILFIGAFTYYFVGERMVFFLDTMAQASYRLYHSDPVFSEAVEISNYINSHPPKNGPLLVLGCEPEIYFYMQRKAATAYVYEYALVEAQPYRDSMRSEYMRQSILSKPTTIITVRTASYDEDFHKQLLQKLHVNADYDLKGYCYKVSKGHDVFVWNNNENGLPYYRVMWEIYEKR